VSVQLEHLLRKGADLGALVKLAKAATPGFAFLDAKAWDELAFGDPWSDGSFLLKAVDKKAMVGAAIGVAHKDGDTKIGYIKYLAVAPKQRRQGLARLLLSELERRFQKRDCVELNVGGCPPPYAQGGVDALDTATHCFLLRRGYERSGSILDMQGDLRAWKPVWSPADKALEKEAGIRKAGPKDAADLDAFLRQNFPHWAWEVGNGLGKGAVFIASRQGRLAGFACANATQKGWFGPMGTLESERGQGLGRLLMWRCLDLLKKQGVKSTRIPWVGPVPFYARYAQASLGPLFWTFQKRL
jgi:mycothiol synthase